jgi:hypothetical protein
MATSQQLQIRPTSGAPLTPEQKRFNTLLRQIEQGRAALRAWQEAIPPFRESHHQLLGPLQEQLRAAQRAWLLALDASGHRGWSRADHETRSELLSDIAGACSRRKPTTRNCKRCSAATQAWTSRTPSASSCRPSRAWPKR